jgi:RNA polymerase sigma-70 factor (ECF subfamily)
METVAIGGAMAVQATPSRDFTSWVEPHLAVLRRYAARRVAPVDADDVVQEALVRAWRRWSTYDDQRGAPLPWLLAIVADRARRHRARANRPGVAAGLAVPPAPHDLDLERALARLPERQRQAVDLYYFADLDVATIAQVMGCAEGTVRATLHQARVRLRELIGGDDA